MAVQRVAEWTPLDAFDRILDKGIVIDAMVRVSVVGIEFISIDARVIVASIETYTAKLSHGAGDVVPTAPAIEIEAVAPPGPEPEIAAEGVVARTVRAAVQAWNAHDPRRYAALLDRRYVGETHAVPLAVRGRGAARRVMRMKCKLFRDLRFHVQDVVTNGNETLVSWVATGTRGNERMRVSGCTVGGVRQGKIVHTWCYWDSDEMLAPLRVLSRRATDDASTLHRFATTR
jgi:ketosteroid isomerase-like protein